MTAASKMSIRMPKGALRLMLPEFQGLFTPEAKQGFVHEAMQIKSEKGDRFAYSYLVEKIGLATLWEHDDSYFSEAFNYMLALLHAYSGQPEKMAEYVRLSKSMPSPDDDQIFSDHNNCSHVVRDHQRGGIARGLPPILIACQPRSASATLTHSLGRLLDIPVLHISIGAFPNYYLAPSWLHMFLEGGAITQDHFGPSDFNVGVLAHRGPTDLFVLVRDPRAAARSQVIFLSNPMRAYSEPLETLIERECAKNFVPWIQGWIDRSKDAECPFKIHWLFFNEVRGDLVGVVRRICRVFSTRYSAMASYADVESVPEVRIHFVTGEDDAWRRDVSTAVSERMWDACTPDVRALLDLRK